ncbi:hypothetical protein SALBM217S_08557 [Streptomyces griseoloalbus]
MTRVIAGAAGDALAVPPGTGTRPTSDRAREGLFSTGSRCSVARLDGERVEIDLYAGLRRRRTGGAVGAPGRHPAASVAAVPPVASGAGPAGVALDETSLFDTSMISAEQLRAYEQGRGNADRRGRPLRAAETGPERNSSILALRSRVGPRSPFARDHRCPEVPRGQRSLRAPKIESRNGPERPPRPPQPSRVRHARAGSASRCAAAPDPHGRRPQGPRYRGGHRSAGRRPGGAGPPPRVGHGRCARHRHRPCAGRGGVRKVSGAARAGARSGLPGDVLVP